MNGLARLQLHEVSRMIARLIPVRSTSDNNTLSAIADRCIVREGGILGGTNEREDVERRAL